MYNYETNRYYILSPDDPDNALHNLPDHKTVQNSGLVVAQIVYLMESRWVKPDPIAVYEGTVSGLKVDIVQTKVFGRRFDFAIDRKSHLPVRFISYFLFKGVEYASTTDLDDYLNVDGIMVPRKETTTDGTVYLSRIQFNVRYDNRIFSQPTPLDKGPFVWQAPPIW